MPTYDYRCPTCGSLAEVFRWISEAEVLPSCCTCEIPMKRAFTGVTVRGVEFGSVTHWDPRAKREKRTHGEHFDLGLGAWVRDKNHRAQLMRQKGLREIPPEKAVAMGADPDYGERYRRRTRSE